MATEQGRDGAIDLARKHATKAVMVLVEIMLSDDAPLEHRMACAIALLKHADSFDKLEHEIYAAATRQ